MGHVEQVCVSVCVFHCTLVFEEPNACLPPPPLPHHRLFHEAELAREEANDNVKFLQPLRKYLDKLNMMDDFQALVDLFKPIFHTLMLIWKHSRYYNNAARFVTLMQQMCNDLIMQASGVGTGKGAGLVGAGQRSCMEGQQGAYVCRAQGRCPVLPACCLCAVPRCWLVWSCPRACVHGLGGRQEQAQLIRAVGSHQLCSL